MPAIRFETPLIWPEGLPATARTQQRADHGFPTPLPLNDSIRYLESELDELGIAATLYLDIEQPNIDRLRKKIGNRTGASLHFKYNGKPYLLACDRWQTPEHNIYALHLALRQWRSIERWGIGTLGVLLSGFEAMRAPEITASGEVITPEWMLVLGLGSTATLEDATAVYHRRAKLVAHDEETLTKLNIIMEEARAYFAGDK